MEDLPINREDKVTQAIKDDAWVPGGVQLESESPLALRVFAFIAIWDRGGHFAPQVNKR